MSRFLIVSQLALGTFWLGCGAASAADLAELKAQRDASQVTLAAGPQLILKYRYGDAPFKPYLKELYTPNGVQILRDSPADHVHHRGVMFGIFANGIDFWSETPTCGKQVSGAFAVQSPNPAGGCTVTQELRWLPAQAERPLLVEGRTLTLHRAADLQATLLTWRTRLQPGEGVAEVKLTGNHYDGFGIRFVESMDQVGQFTYASGTAGPLVRGTERVTPAKWAAYTAPAAGKKVTIAIFDHPQNARHPAGMFTMLQHFSYLSATFNVWKTPLTLTAGQALDLRWGVAAWDGEIGKEQIESLYQRWLRL